MSSATVQVLEETALSVRSKTPWLRLALLIGALLLLNLTMVALSSVAFRTVSISGVWILSLFQGWLLTMPALAAMWLTWGNGSIVWRLPVTLGVTMLAVAFVAVLRAQEYNPALVMFAHMVLEQFIMILGLHAVMMPLRGYLGWHFWFSPPAVADEKPKRGAKWSLLHIMVWTAFAAFPLAFARLLAVWQSDWGAAYPWIEFPLIAVITMVAPVAATFALFFEEQPKLLRLSVALLAMPAVCLLMLAIVGLLGQPIDPRLSALASLGLTASAFANLLLVRLFGVRLHRPSRLAVPS